MPRHLLEGNARRFREVAEANPATIGPSARDASHLPHQRSRHLSSASPRSTGISEAPGADMAAGSRRARGAPTDHVENVTETPTVEERPLRSER
jgi:hypothetical protein